MEVLKTPFKKGVFGRKRLVFLLRRLGLCLVLLVLLGYAGFLLLDEVFPFPWERLSRPSSQQVADRNGAPLRFYLAADDRWYFPVTLEQVAPVMRRAVVASEDRFFRWHPGVNPLSVLRAAWSNLARGRVVSGGSTITMQLARLAVPRERTLAAKCVEAFRALQLEQGLGKDRLLEAYLNLAPYGGNIVGVGAAAWFYFGKSPDKLSLGEAALLAVIPRSPRRYDPVRHPKAALAVRNTFLRRAGEQGVFDTEAVSAALREPLPLQWFAAPMLAPHFCDMARELDAQGVYPEREQEPWKLRTTLDARLQRIVDSVLEARVPGLRQRGLENAAVVVLETETRSVRALAGSADYLDKAHHGPINGTNILRSPGSALKPFCYAKAFDAGLIVPDSLLLDIPTDYAGYSPRNYDGVYHGQVSAREALSKSLNTPAVRLLARLGLPHFHQLLMAGGLRHLDADSGRYGLPLVLGACEVTLLELVDLYAVLASQGKYAPVRMLAGQPVAGEKSLLSPEAAYLTTEILATVKRSDLPTTWNLTRDVPEVAWKTGTSFGHRDAWAVGYSAHYTVGVWVGNLDGGAEKGISGAEHAGPLLFDIFRAIEPGGTALPEPEMANIDLVEVCADSRELATPACDRRMLIQQIPGVSRIPQDSMHRRIFVDAATGERLEGDCLVRRPHRSLVIRTYPVALTAWRQATGAVPADESLPPLSPLCAVVPEGDAPRIVSPSARTPYKLRRDAPARFQLIPLRAQSAVDAGTLYWYQDGRFVASGPAGTTLFLAPEKGRHKLAAVDEKGRMDSLWFTVE